MNVKVQNRAGLPADRLEALKADLSLLEKSRMGLGERAFRYAVDGDAPDVIADIAATTDAHEVLHLTCSTHIYNTHKAAELRCKKIFAGLVADGDFLLRMADIYEAASRNAQRKLAGGPFGLPEWLECFLIEVTQDRYSAEPNKGVLEAAAIEQMLAARGAPADLAIRTLVNIKPRDWSCHQLANVLRTLKGMGAAMERCPAPVLDVLTSAPADQRVHVLEMMTTLNANPEPFLDKLIELGVSSAKTVREAALPLLRRQRSAASKRRRPRWPRAPTTSASRRSRSSGNWRARIRANS